MVLLPLLISVLGVPPIVAVGSDAVINFVTKIGAGSLHWRKGNVSWLLVWNLATGSIPGAILGVLVLSWVRAAYGNGVNEFLRGLIGVLLVVIPLGYIFNFRRSLPAVSFEALHASPYRFGIALIGFFAGILVGLTSIGSGSVILMLLLVFYGFPPGINGRYRYRSRCSPGCPNESCFNSGLATSTSFWFPRVLLGSVPGGLLGAYLTNHIPSGRMKQVLCALLMVVGARLLWGVFVHAKRMKQRQYLGRDRERAACGQLRSQLAIHPRHAKWTTGADGMSSLKSTADSVTSFERNCFATGRAGCPRRILTIERGCPVTSFGWSILSMALANSSTESLSGVSLLAWSKTASPLPAELQIRRPAKSS